MNREWEPINLISQRRFLMDTEWKPTYAYLPKPLVTGGKSRPLESLMRKKCNGVWIYRLMTKEERAEEWLASQW